MLRPSTFLPNHLCTTPLARIAVLTTLMGTMGVAHPATSRSEPPLVDARPLTERSTKAGVLRMLGRVPLRFEANLGQTAPFASFLSRGKGYSLFISPTEALFILGGGSGQIASFAALYFTVIAWSAKKMPGFSEKPGISSAKLGDDPIKYPIRR